MEEIITTTRAFVIALHIVLLGRGYWAEFF